MTEHIEEELIDEVPAQIQAEVEAMIASSSPCSEQDAESALEPEDEYASRPVPALPPASLLHGLSRLWAYPAKGEAYVRSEMQTLMAHEELSAYKDELNAIYGLLEEYKNSTEEIVGADVVQLDYTRMFIGSFKMYAPPYASYYMDGENQIYGPTAAAVEDLYATFGLEINMDEHDMPDHIRFLLEFMSLLANAYQTQGVVDFAHAYTDFKEMYVGEWTQQFTENLEKYGSYPFYKQLLAFTLKSI